MPIDLYHVPGSTPCRMVRLVAAAVGVHLNLIYTDLMAGEQLKPEFIKMNPQHTVPTMNDNGFYLGESRAICTYLVEQYGKNDTLYPKEPQKRALVNQRLYFDMGTLYQAFADYYYPQMFAGAPADPAKFEKVLAAFEFLEKFLEGKKYLAGDHLTVADLVSVVTVSSYTVFDFDMSKFPNTVRWYERIKAEAPMYEETNGAGVKAFNELKEQCMHK